MRRNAYTVTLDDGRTFPTYGGQILSWDIGAQLTNGDESEGFPRTLTVIRAMREERPEHLERERISYLRSSFDMMFGHNARKVLNLIDKD